MKLFKNYSLKNEQKQALKIANKNINKLHKLVNKYQKKALKAKETKKQLIFNAVVYGLNLELEQAYKDLKTITIYYNRLLFCDLVING